MSEKETGLTIARGLKEIKAINKKLELKYAQIELHCSKMDSAPDAMNNQAEYIKREGQAVRDLLQRTNDIKIAIQKANLELSFTYKGKTYTLAEALIWKQLLKKEYESFYDAFTPITATSQIQLERMNLGVVDEEKVKRLGMFPKLFYNEEEVQKWKEDHLDFTGQVDALIDQANHSHILKGL
jgi:hypothetical protein